jgi:GNAT superfamily N-acetyltransferase
MTFSEFPAEFRLERLARSHPRKPFASGQPLVDDWLRTKALQNQEKRLSVTKVLVDSAGAIAGYYTLATGQVDFGDLPEEVSKKLPRRMLPAAVLAWLGVDSARQGQGLGGLLLGQALRDCHEASRIFAFVGVILDSLDGTSKAFYQKYDFAETPGHPHRLFLSAARLEAMMDEA